MKTRRINLMAVVILLGLSFIFFAGCKTSEAPQEGGEQAAVQTQTGTDTARAQQEVMAPRLKELQEQKTAIESRLQTLLTQVEEKEKALAEREKRARDQESMLSAKAASLDEREARLDRQQTISWIALAIGLASLILALFLLRRQRGTFGKGAENKNAYIEKLESQFKDWSAKLDELKAKASDAKDEVKDEYNKQIDALRARQEAAQQKLQELKGAGEEAWREMKKGVDDAWKEMNKALKEAASKLR
jgi:predicted  nucleic acid-binding Zn-ribbon protein